MLNLFKDKKSSKEEGSVHIQQCLGCNKWKDGLVSKYCPECSKGTNSTIKDLQKKLTEAIKKKDPNETLKINKKLQAIMGITNEPSPSKEKLPLLEYINT